MACGIQSTAEIAGISGICRKHGCFLRQTPALISAAHMQTGAETTHGEQGRFFDSYGDTFFSF